MVRRTAQVMNAFTTQSRWGVRELASHLAVPKSGLHRTLQEMAAEDLVRSDEEGAYYVSAELLRLASGLMQAADLTRVAFEHLKTVRDVTGETALLEAYDDDRQQVIAVDTVTSAHPIQFIWGALREWTDLHLSASGRGILAFLPESDIERYFSTPRVMIDGKRATFESMKAELADIRERGWAITYGERIPGVTGACAPIRDGRGLVIGGIVVVWPARADEEPDADAIGRACRDAALAASADLGWRAP